jgi:CxxC-x17-CxxC domain-containing protein
MKKQLQNEPDILGFMTRIQEQLTALDKKMDLWIQTSQRLGRVDPVNKSLPQSNQARPPLKPSFQQPVNAQAQANARPNDHHQGRPMFRATCADCKKECELPFKPSGDRPVYCKECFRQRKSGNTFKLTTDNKPQAAPPVQSVINAASHIPEPPVKEKKKPSAVKRSGGKKKTIAKKKKK